MELKNITPFNEFRRITEANVPSEFSNNTGFKESLVGRAVFGILRYFQKGINLGRLEFYKRKLENEYFAGLLRFCAVKDIDLLTGLEPSGLTSSATGGTSTPGPSNPDEVDYCKALNFDHVNDKNGNFLTGVQSGFTNLITILTPLANGDPADPDVKDAMDTLERANKVVECCNAKWVAVERFLDLQALSGSTDVQVVALLDEIKKFFDSPVAKYCSTYHGTDEEKNLIRSFANSTNVDIKNKVAELEPLIVDSYKYRGYDLIEEKITSGLNKFVGITQMLGDQLTSTSGSSVPSMKVNIYDWLKEKGINDVNKINFVELEKLFRSKGDDDNSYRKQASAFVNIDGIKKIQYAVARIIFHVKKTPDNLGINPGAGGGASFDEDTDLRTSWEKRVEFCKSEFTNFLDVESTLDPFRLMNLSDAMRKRDPSYEKSANSMRVQTNVLADSLTMSTKAAQMGLRARGNEQTFYESRLYVYMMSFNNSIEGGPFYPVFTLKKIGSNVVYRYVGCINFTQIIADKAFDDPNWQNNAKNYGASAWGNPGSKADNDLISKLKVRPVPAINGYKFDSMYMATTNYDNIYSYKDNPQDKNIKLLYAFVADGQIAGNFQGASMGATSFKLKYLSNAPSVLNDIPDTNFGDIKGFMTNDKMYNGHFGEAYEIDANWHEKYFAPSGSVLMHKYILQNKYINDIPYSNAIKLKP